MVMEKDISLPIALLLNYRAGFPPIFIKDIIDDAFWHMPHDLCVSFIEMRCERGRFLALIHTLLHHSPCN